jgi:hypothetical protein
MGNFFIFKWILTGPQNGKPPAESYFTTPKSHERPKNEKSFVFLKRSG